MIWFFSLFVFFSGVAEEAPPLEPPYTRAPAQEDAPPVEPPYTKKEKKQLDSYPAEDLTQRRIPQPTSINEDTGTYYYEEKSSQDALYYEIDEDPETDVIVYGRLGTVSPYEIQVDGTTFEELYTDSSSLLAYFEYEWNLGYFLGKWGLKLGSGATFADGNGRFVGATNAALTPRESFTFVTFPNTLLASYKFQFSDRQTVIPYADFGGGYMGFIEYRNDGDKTSIGGAPMLVAAGGLLINLRFLDIKSVNNLFEEYGIHEIWLDLQFRRNESLDDVKDFSSDMITTGFGFAY